LAGPRASDTTEAGVPGPPTESLYPRPTGDGGSPAPGRRAVAVVGGVLVALVLFALSVAMVPVTQSRPLGPEEASATRVATPVPSRVVIAVSGSGTVVVQPSLDMPEVFSTELVESLGPFSANQQGFTSVSPGSLTLSGTFGDLVLTFAAVPDAAGVTVERQSDGQTRTWRLTPEELGGGRTLQVPSPTARSSVSSAYLFTGTDVPAGTAVSVGAEPIRVDSGHYTALTALPTVAGAALRGWGILAAAVATICVLWLVGRALLRPERPTSGARSVPTVAIGLSLGLALCLSNSLAYFISARTAAYVVAALALVLVVVRYRRVVAGLRSEMSSLGTRVLWVLPAAVVAFFPMFYWGLWYAGQYRTDLYEYASLASIARDASLLDMRGLAEAQHSGILTAGAGFSWRSIDSIGGGVVSALTGLSTVPALTFLGLLLFLVNGIAVMDLTVGEARRETGHRRVRLAIAALALFNPLLTALFVENYYSQFVFVALLPALVVAVRVVLVPGETEHPKALTWAVAALAGVMIAVYPYFFALAAVALAVAAMLRSDTRRAMGRLLWSIMWKVAVVVNLAVLTIINFGQVDEFERGLDAITRNVLIRGWGPLDLASMFGGLQSYQLRADVPEAEVSGPLGALAGLANRASMPSTALLVLGLVALVVLLLSVDVRATLSSFQALAVYAVVLAWIAFCLYYGLGQRPYVMLKSGWVAAALVPSVIAVTRFHRPGRWAALVAVGAVAATAWLPTMVADRATWLVPLTGIVDRTSHVAVVPDLVAVRNAIEPGDRVALVMGEEPLAGSDQDRVLLAQTEVLVRDIGAVCVNCVGGNPPPPVDCAVARPDVVVTVGVTGGVGAGCGLSRRSGTLADVYVR
jgi:hypothetical protein